MTDRQAPALRWHQDYAGWATGATEFHATAHRIPGGWMLSVHLFGRPAYATPCATLAVAKADASAQWQAVWEAMPV